MILRSWLRQHKANNNLIHSGALTNPSGVGNKLKLGRGTRLNIRNLVTSGKKIIYSKNYENPIPWDGGGGGGGLVYS